MYIWRLFSQISHCLSRMPNREEDSSKEALFSAPFLVVSFAELFSCVRLLATLWTVACQAPLSMGILQARILEWVARPSSREIFPTQGLSPGLPHCRWILYWSPTLQVELPGLPSYYITIFFYQYTSHAFYQFFHWTVIHLRPNSNNNKAKWKKDKYSCFRCKKLVIYYPDSCQAALLLSKDTKAFNISSWLVFF